MLRKMMKDLGACLGVELYWLVFMGRGDDQRAYEAKALELSGRLQAGAGIPLSDLIVILAAGERKEMLVLAGRN